jgi:beta-1,2-mannobiose phosphorylase / 1,2-beta-oligomannan phosphorylase
MNSMQATPSRILTRCLLRPADVQSRFDRFEVIGTFNPAAIEFDGGVVLLVRVAERPTETREGYVALPYWNSQRGDVAIDWRLESEVELIDPRMVRIKSSGLMRLTFLSWLLVAFSRDGLTIDSFGTEAFLPANRYETFGVEDARLTRIDDRYYFTYVAVSEYGVATSLASTADFKSFQRHGIVFCPDNKDVVLFPEKIDDQYVALHRPSTQGSFSIPEIWSARSPDLTHWGSHRRLLGAEVAWATAKIGGGTPPIRTDRGWLILFHGLAKPDACGTGGVGQYAAATLLLDLEQPERVIGFSPVPVMVAEQQFERQGFLPDIVFPSGLVRHEDRLLVYYGAADTATGVAQYSLSGLLASVTFA